MNKVGIFFGSTTGNTEAVAEMIKERLGEDLVDLHNVDSASAEDVEEYDNLIFGTSTWGLGDLQDDFMEFVEGLADVNLDGKVVALFGLGDSASYPDTFCDGIGEIYETISDKCTVVGSVSKDGYEFDDSKALDGDVFVGLPLDADNEEDQHEDRVDAWLEDIKAKFN